MNTKAWKLETDLSIIKAKGRFNEDINFEFRAYLKSQDEDKIDKIVHRLNDSVSKQIDCTQCANCCKTLFICVHDDEIKKISEHINMNAADFESQYIYVDEFNDKNFVPIPCRFLKGKLCSIYDVRPLTCSSYPNLHKKEFTSRLFFVLENYSVCPIVYNVFEQLKHELRFR